MRCSAIGDDDLARAKPFYDRLLKPLGIVCRANYPNGVGYGPAGGRPRLRVVSPIDRSPATVGNGIAIGLEAANRASVEACHAAAMAADGKDEGAPGLRAHYHPNCYDAYVRDPDGNKIGVVCHEKA